MTEDFIASYSLNTAYYFASSQKQEDTSDEELRTKNVAYLQ